MRGDNLQGASQDERRFRVLMPLPHSGKQCPAHNPAHKKGSV